jgi:hypothetical protein
MESVALEGVKSVKGEKGAKGNFCRPFPPSAGFEDWEGRGSGGGAPGQTLTPRWGLGGCHPPLQNSMVRRAPAPARCLCYNGITPSINLGASTHWREGQHKV